MSVPDETGWRTSLSNSPATPTAPSRPKHAGCKHTRYDRLLIQFPHADRAEAWERLASTLYAREHPEAR